MNLLRVRDEMVAWCQEVGRLQLNYFRQENLIIEQKSSASDLVTEADKRSEELLVGHIRKKYPQTSILAEESGVDDRDSAYRWVIDPLDGTSNFARGLPIFAVSLALECDGHPVVGVVFAPYLNEMYSAVEGEGAYLGTKLITVGSRTNLDSAVLGTGFPYDKAENHANNVAETAYLLPRIAGLRRMGAAAYDLCSVARGGLDGFWELNLGPWDVAAGRLLVQEAGGVVLPWRNDRRVSIIAANFSLAPLIKDALAMEGLGA